MFEILEPWAVGLAVVLDTALLAVLLERRNRPFARVPIVVLLASAWTLHVGAFLLLAVGPLSGFGAAAIEKLCLLATAAAILLKPSAMLHAAIRFSQTGFDLRTRGNPRYALLYLPLVAIVPLAFAVHPSAESSFLGPLLPWAMPYVVWASIANLVAAGVFVRERSRVRLPGVQPFFVSIAALLVLQTALLLFVFGYAWSAWPLWHQRLLFLCGTPSIAITLLFGYFLVRFNFLQLAMERAIVYGAVLAGLAMFHQFAFQEAAAALPRSYRLALVALEAALIGALVALYRPLRQRCAEAARYLVGNRTSERRERLRQFSTQLSAKANLPADKILDWFAAELTSSLDVEFVSGWLFRAGAAPTRYGAADRLADDHAAALVDHLRGNGLAISFPPYAIGAGHLEALQRAGVSLAVHKTHSAIDGLLLVGKHARSRDLGEEEASAVLLLVEQLAVALENSQLVAERLAAERRAAHLEKLSALGLMASAIAHEVKNPLSAIKTIAAVLAENLGPESPHAEDVAMIRGEIDRLAKTTRQLLEIARPQESGDRPLQVEHVLSNTAEILRRLASQKDVAIETHVAGDLPPIRGDETTLREIVFNLASNSLDAAATGGRITLTGVRLNGHVVIEVRDDGPGIDPKVMSRLFEPFVTTKPAGTGLGLYVVRRRVAELGGDVACESTPGLTSFIVKIPAHDAPHSDRR